MFGSAVLAFEIQTAVSAAPRAHLHVRVLSDDQGRFSVFLHVGSPKYTYPLSLYQNDSENAPA